MIIEQTETFDKATFISRVRDDANYKSEHYHVIASDFHVDISRIESHNRVTCLMQVDDRIKQVDEDTFYKAYLDMQILYANCK